MKPQSKHFSLREFEGRGPAPARVYPAIQRVMDALEVIRTELSFALHGERGDIVRGIITPAGGYRSPAVNKENKGRAADSRHTHGDAADVRWHYCTPDGKWFAVPPSMIYREINRLQKEGSIPKGGLAVYVQRDPMQTYTHVDCRGYLARWKPVPK